jgi:hypothetical protein
MIFLFNGVRRTQCFYTRGRIPAHEFRESMEVSYLLLQAKACMSRHQFLMFEIDVYNFFDFGTQQSTLPVAARAYIINDK